MKHVARRAIRRPELELAPQRITGDTPSSRSQAQDDGLPRRLRIDERCALRELARSSVVCAISGTIDVLHE
jgi:hypothetical protein